MGGQRSEEGSWSRRGRPRNSKAKLWCLIVLSSKWTLISVLLGDFGPAAHEPFHRLPLPVHYEGIRRLTHPYPLR